MKSYNRILTVLHLCLVNKIKLSFYFKYKWKIEVGFANIMTTPYLNL